MNLRPILTPVNMAVSVAMYWPLLKRILSRRKTADFSKATQWGIVYLQLASLWLAAMEHAWYLFAYYVLQTTLCTALLYLIYRYYEGDE